MDAVTVTTNDRAHIEGFVADALLMDSFDRVIVAQAEANAAPLVTKDLTIRQHYARAVW